MTKERRDFIANELEDVLDEALMSTASPQGGGWGHRHAHNLGSTLATPTRSASRQETVSARCRGNVLGE